MKFRWGSVLAALILFGLVGCQTPPVQLSPSEQWIKDNLSVREKSDVLVDKGTALYAQMLDEDSLKYIAKIKTILETALKADPANQRASEALKTLDTFVTKRQTDAQNKVKVLTAKSAATLSEKEKYDLVVVFQQLQLLAPPNFDLKKLNDQVTPIRTEVVKTKSANIQDYETKLQNPKFESSAGKMVSLMHDEIVSLQVVDPTNAGAKAATDWLDKFLVARNQTDLEAAKKAYAAKDYSTAAKTAGRVEQSLAGIGSDNTGEVDALLYKVYFDWAKDLLTAKKYGEATSRVGEALNLNSTAEALDLRDKIAKASLTRDYDAEYDSIDKQLASLIAAGDLKTAWNLANSTGNQLKKEDTKTKLSGRKKQILDATHALYDAAVASYGDEDYREAKLGFDVVVAIDPAWQLVKSYQDKAKAKLQALGGKP
ncbi:MAG: hypothetical protein WCG80_10775 [Spirochaetales bacterium]